MKIKGIKLSFKCQSRWQYQISLLATGQFFLISKSNQSSPIRYICKQWKNFILKYNDNICSIMIKTKILLGSSLSERFFFIWEVIFAQFLCDSSFRSSLYISYFMRHLLCVLVLIGFLVWGFITSLYLKFKLYQLLTSKFVLHLLCVWVRKDFLVWGEVLARAVSEGCSGYPEWRKQENPSGWGSVAEIKSIFSQMIFD